MVKEKFLLISKLKFSLSICRYYYRVEQKKPFIRDEVSWLVSMHHQVTVSPFKVTDDRGASVGFNHCNPVGDIPTLLI